MTNIKSFILEQTQILFPCSLSCRCSPDRLLRDHFPVLVGPVAAVLGGRGVDRDHPHALHHLALILVHSPLLLQRVLQVWNRTVALEHFIKRDMTNSVVLVRMSIKTLYKEVFGKMGCSSIYMSIKTQYKER